MPASIEIIRRPTLENRILVGDDGMEDYCPRLHIDRR